MFFMDSQEPDSDILLPEVSPDRIHSQPVSSPPLCSQGHRSTVSLSTQQGGTICLLCFSNLISDPRAPTLHISYALSQLSLALSQPLFLRSLLSFHSHFLVSPLVHALSSFDDVAIANQIVDVICVLSSSEGSSIGGDFVERLADQLSSGALGWSRRQLYVLHCFGVLMNCKNVDIYAHIKEKSSLVCHLVDGLQLPNEEIRGETLFVLYKFAALQCTHEDGSGADVLSSFCPKLLYLSLEALAKTQRDDLRLNCLALLTILAQQGVLANSPANYFSNINRNEGDNPMQTAEPATDGPHLNILFAQAIKGPLLSTDSQVQIGSLDLIYHYVSQENIPSKHIQVLVEENIADYVFEILRLSEYKDPLINSCLRILDLFFLAEHAFRQRLVVGFPSVIQVLHLVGDVAFHPFQVQTLKLILICVSDFPGIASSSQAKDIVLVLTRMLEKYYYQEMGLLPDAFTTICSIFAALLRAPSFVEIDDVVRCLQDSLKHAIVACVSPLEKDSNQIFHAVYLLNEVYAYCSEPSPINRPGFTELRHCIIDACTSHLLPWFLSAVNEINEETALGVLETFHFILLQNSDIQVIEFANILVSAAWFSFSFGFLGYFTSAKTRLRVYLMLSSLVDILLGDKMGQPIRDSAPCLPSDPKDLLFLLGQDGSNNSELSSCQSAVLLIFHTSSLYNDRLADDNLVLGSLERYTLVNRACFISGLSASPAMLHFVNLYSLYRSLQNERNQINYNSEAERIIFHLLNENEWDLCSEDIHSASLKWLFQQEEIGKGLGHQILKFSRSNTIMGNQAHNIYEKNRQRSFVYRLAELVLEGDNYGATLLVYLLIQLAEKEQQENDIISILNLMTAIICVFPAASDQLSFQGVGNAIQRLFCSSTNSSLEQIFTSLLLSMFNILASVQPEALKDEGSWVALTMKLLNYTGMQEAVITQSHEGPLVIGILCLVLYHSSKGALMEASKSIVLTSSLASAINNVISSACSKGPALTNCHKGAGDGDSLTFMLLLSYFSFKSLQAVLPGAVDWQTFFDPSDKLQSLPVVSIRCHDLCRLMHFGTPLIKFVASYCLLELFTGISEQLTTRNETIMCSSSYLNSVKAVLEGLIFYDDIQVAINSAICLSIILEWEDLEMQERRDLFKTSSWSRLIAEEMSVSLAVPCSASKSFLNLHKPAVYVTVAILKLKNKPEWVRTVFDDSSISSVIKNLSAANISREIVLLFQELLRSQFLNTEQITLLNHVFEAGRRQMQRSEPHDEMVAENVQRTIFTVDEHGEICNYLIHLMTAEPEKYTGPDRSQGQKKQLLDEIEQFLKLLSTRPDDNP